MPQRMPWNAIAAMPASSSAPEIAYATWRRPMKSNRVPGGTSSITRGSPSDRERRDGSRAGIGLVHQAREDERGEHARDHAYRERHREALDRTGAELVQHERGD